MKLGHRPRIDKRDKSNSVAMARACSPSAEYQPRNVLIPALYKRSWPGRHSSSAIRIRMNLLEFGTSRF